jgi:hypothetical protein
MITSILAKENEIVKIFPEMQQTFTDVKSKLKNSKCITCDEHKYLNLLINEYNKNINRKNIRHLLPIAYIKKSYITNDKYKELRIVRPPCKQCVIKHLATALEYHSEIVTSYPAHIEYALENVKLAMTYAHPFYKNDITNVLALYKEYKSNSDINYLIKIEDVIKDIFLKIDKDTPITIYKLIGQLVHAEEECWKYNLKLAHAIQDERHKFMEDHNYKINFEKIFTYI